MSDREALLELFRSTKGRFWTRKDNWVSDEPYRKWFGITISSSGHVATLDLKRNYLQDRIDSVVSWKRLTNLQTLCLMDNKISGTIPEAIGDLPALEELDLSWNIMEGTLPESLYDLTRLRVLKLEHNRFSGEISPLLGKLTRLRFLNLSMNRLSGKVPHVGQQLTELKIIDLSHNLLQEPVPTLVKEFVELGSADDHMPDIRDGEVEDAGGDASGIIENDTGA